MKDTRYLRKAEKEMPRHNDLEEANEVDTLLVPTLPEGGRTSIAVDN